MEGDVISIVGGVNMSLLVGNFDFTAYRLCKFATDKIQTYELDEDITIEISDDDDGTSYYPVKMELEPTPEVPPIVNVRTTTETKSFPSLIDVQHPSMLSPENPKPLLYVDVQTSIQTQAPNATKAIPFPATSTCFHDTQPLNQNGDDFDLANYILDKSAYEELDEM